MGCDIHLFAEARFKKTIIQKLKFWKKPVWQSIDKWILDEGYEPPRMVVDYNHRLYRHRNYNLFCALCGVRSNHFYDDPISISDPKGLPQDCCDQVKQASEDYGDDGHSHSYNTLKELKEFDWSPYGETCNEFLEKVIPALEAIRVKDDDVRIVYFFDN